MEKNVYVTVRYAETDKMGIAHHTSYIIWYEEARTEIIKSFGFTYSQLEEAGVMCPLAKLECKYIKPAKYEDELCVNVKISKITPVKIEFDYKILNGDGDLLNEGKTIHPWVSEKMKIMNLKKEKPEIYGKMLATIAADTGNILD